MDGRTIFSLVLATVVLLSVILSVWTPQHANYSCLPIKSNLFPLLGSRDVVVHVGNEAAPVVAFGGLGAAVGAFMEGDGGGIAIFPHYGFLGEGFPNVTIDVRCGLAGIVSGSAMMEKEFRYSVVNVGKSYFVLVRPPMEDDVFSEIESVRNIYEVSSVQMSTESMAHGTSLFLGALQHSMEIAGVVFHGCQTVTAMILSSETTNNKYPFLYIAHDGLGEMQYTLTRENVLQGFGGVRLSGGRIDPNSPSQVHLDRVFRYAKRDFVSVTSTAVSFATSVAIVSPSLASDVLPFGPGLTPVSIVYFLG